MQFATLLEEHLHYFEHVARRQRGRMVVGETVDGPDLSWATTLVDVRFALELPHHGTAHLRMRNTTVWSSPDGVLGVVAPAVRDAPLTAARHPLMLNVNSDWLALRRFRTMYGDGSQPLPWHPAITAALGGAAFALSVIGAIAWPLLLPPFRLPGCACDSKHVAAAPFRACGLVCVLQSPRLALTSGVAAGVIAATASLLRRHEARPRRYTLWEACSELISPLSSPSSSSCGALPCPVPFRAAAMACAQEQLCFHLRGSTLRDHVFFVDSTKCNT